MINPSDCIASTEIHLEVLPGVSPPALLPLLRRHDGLDSIKHEILQLQSLDQISVPDEAAVGNLREIEWDHSINTQCLAQCSDVGRRPAAKSEPVSEKSFLKNLKILIYRNSTFICKSLLDSKSKYKSVYPR